MTSSKERCALVTGASSGIGRATALAFAKAGIHLVMVGRSLEKLNDVAASAQQAGVSARFYPLDLAKVDQVQGCIAAITAADGPVDILVNCAGMGYTAPLGETSLTDWQRVLDLNLTSVLQCVQGVLPGMRVRQRGLIVNVTSIAAHQVFPSWGLYCVSKFGLLALSRALAMEERPHGIRVSTICPGAVDTPLWDTDTVQADLDRSAMLTPEIVAQSILKIALLPEQAVIEELTLLPAAGAL